MKQIKDTIASILYRIIALIVKLLPASNGKNHLLIIKPDEIGDYIIFRNLLPVIRRSDRFKGCKITLLANSSCKDLFQCYDQGTVDNVIWINKKKLNRDLRYRFAVLKQVRRLHTSDVLNFIYSRSILLDDGFAFVATGSNKIAMNFDKANRSEHTINLDNLIYSRIVDSGDAGTFDSIRNKQFLTQIIGNESIPVDTKLKQCDRRDKKKYFAIFLGAGNPERNWPVEYFITCAEYVKATYNLEVYVFGGPPDVERADSFLRNYRGNAINYAGKTTLLQFVHLLDDVLFMISVDTGPLHMAIANCCPVIGLFSGKYYKRYAPYPPEVATILFPLYPDTIDILIKENNPVLYNSFVTKNNTIKFISPEKVIKAIDKQMAGNGFR